MENELRAICYYYLKAKESLSSPELKGLRRKGVFDFVKSIEKISQAYEKNQIIDYDKIMEGVKIECSR